MTCSGSFILVLFGTCHSFKIFSSVSLPYSNDSNKDKTDIWAGSFTIALPLILTHFQCFYQFNYFNINGLFSSQGAGQSRLPCFSFSIFQVPYFKLVDSLLLVTPLTFETSLYGPSAPLMISTGLGLRSEEIVSWDKSLNRSCEFVLRLLITKALREEQVIGMTSDDKSY